MPPREIDFGNYYQILKKRLWFIIVCVVLSTAAAAFYNNSTYQPLYQVSAKLLVNKTAQPNKSGLDQNDLGATGNNVNLINTYKEIIKTPVIMEKVVQRNPDLNLTAEQLISGIKVTADNETQIMTITAINHSYEGAVSIVNAVSKVFQTEVPKIFRVDNVTILTKAEAKDHPRPLNEKKNTIIFVGFAASLVASIGIVLFLESLDDTVKTEEDIRLILGKPMLSAVPRLRKKELRSLKVKKTSPKLGESAYEPIKN